MLRLDWNLLFNAINIIILFLLLKHFLFKPVNQIIEKRREEAEQQFKEAKDLTDQAQKTKKQYEESLRSAEEEKSKIVAQARREAAGEYSRIVEEAHEKADSILDKAKAEAELEKEKVLQKAHAEIKDMVVTATTKIVTRKDNAENDKALYDEFLSKAK
ncbi:MAG TPA: F0F1 ATP synthase subunit B [Candidatus Choladousia intestinavium]|uniref:ATP synthase subunit b n=1 Tax=Candidatus Choladousia intestinavium TaxID=2840727 RepID=A0A9D1AAS0_9FIRM|nr:F0F1 ATP synthase subunit B [Candidatus Choladousia intestinavium]